jgi:DNA helicase-2/ATP-dependent DNA helicase PcrA
MTIQVENIHAAFTSKSSLTVEAGAGCGKTTLIVKGERLLPRQTLFLAFNKSIADELSSRMPLRTCKTFHAIALSNLTSRLGRLKVDAYKYEKLATHVGCSRDEAKAVAAFIDKFQLQVAGCYLSPSEWTPELFKEVIPESDIFDIEIPDNSSMDYVLAMATQVLQSEAKKLSGLTFSDMLFFLVHYSITNRWSLRDWDCVVVDEAQDVSPIRLEIIKRLSNRVIQVGDPRQAIYAFAGAMSGAMREIADAFGCVSYPLSVTWRCANAIVREASDVVGDFLTARPDAPEGFVGEVPLSYIFQSSLDNQSMIVCRANAPLIKVATGLMKDGTPFNFMSEMPERLAKRSDKLATGASGMAAYKTAVRDFYDKKMEEIKSKNLRARLQDELDCILLCCSYVSAPKEVGEYLRRLSYSKSGVLLTTGHKAKGLEAENVYILRPDLIPAPWVDPDNEEQYQQELNLKYVMITRAKQNLFYITPEE